MFKSVQNNLKKTKSNYKGSTADWVKKEIEEINLVLHILFQIEKGGLKYSKEEHEAGRQIIISLK